MGCCQSDVDVTDITYPMFPLTRSHNVIGTENDTITKLDRCILLLKPDSVSKSSYTYMFKNILPNDTEHLIIVNIVAPNAVRYRLSIKKSTFLISDKNGIIKNFNTVQNFTKKMKSVFKQLTTISTSQKICTNT